MYDTCPKCHYQRKSSDTSDKEVCPACGLIFSKWMKSQFASTPVSTNNDTFSNNNKNIFQLLLGHFLYVEPKTDSIVFYFRAGAYILIFLWGWNFILMDFRTNEIGESMMHVINLVFHEAGHVIFSPFGKFITVLGGTLGQLLMPLIVMLTFTFKQHNNFGASIGLWWLGQSLMDCAPYINDANDLQLVLLGGVTGLDKPGFHDWQYLLYETGLFDRERELAMGADLLGSFIMIVSMAWGAWLLYQQYKNLG